MRKYYIIIAIAILGSLVFYSYFAKKGVFMANFSKSTISSGLRREMIKKNIWSSNCPVAIDRLNLLKVSYFDFDGNERNDGELVVLDVVADHVLAVFKQLHQQKFPINSIKLINDYNGDDEKSMLENNSSAFNCRAIKDSKIFSMHSYGLAIDINPQQNPYLITKYDIGKTAVPIYPPQGMEYINRSNIRAGMVESVINEDAHETVVDLFVQHGFTVWGGSWNDPIDWHHFQLNRDQANVLLELSYAEGVKYFEQFTRKKVNNSSEQPTIDKDKY